ncbi:uncharacterized protein LOC108037512 [Drosophila rhopaloa]|uniref:Uncharacterized protein LOC108037512 n=1 Tax=Drosophila rhopaloa TaxID=1041015 RepID=A0A6P4DVX4_DRORH|nr:uncharacterized protein LOC108037512 [Drosophila rhopaloa]
MSVYGVILLIAVLALGSCNAVRCILTCHTLAGDYTSVEI